VRGPTQSVRRSGIDRVKRRQACHVNRGERHHASKTTKPLQKTPQNLGLENVAAGYRPHRQGQLAAKGSESEAMNMLVDPSRHEGEPSAVKAHMAPQAGGIEAVIQQAVEHVTAFSASLEQRRAEAQLEQALTVCHFIRTLLLVS